MSASGDAVLMSNSQGLWIADVASGTGIFTRLLLDSGNRVFAIEPNAEMRAASLLSGSKRYSAYGNLDVSMMQNNPPWAARNNFNDRILVSKRVGCFTFNSIYSVDLAALCLK